MDTKFFTDKAMGAKERPELIASANRAGTTLALEWVNGAFNLACMWDTTGNRPGSFEFTADAADITGAELNARIGDGQNVLRTGPNWKVDADVREAYVMFALIPDKGEALALAVSMDILRGFSAPAGH